MAVTRCGYCARVECEASMLVALPLAEWKAHPIDAIMNALSDCYQHGVTHDQWRDLALRLDDRLNIESEQRAWAVAHLSKIAAAVGLTEHEWSGSNPEDALAKVVELRRGYKALGQALIERTLVCEGLQRTLDEIALALDVDATDHRALILEARLAGRLLDDHRPPKETP